MSTVEWFIRNRLHEWKVSRSGHTGGWTVRVIADNDDGEESEYTLEFAQYDMVSQTSIATRVLKLDQVLEDC